MIHWLAADHTDTIASDSKETFLWYTELGWEVTVGRLKAIRMINEGKITKTDTIVTLADRMFFYSKFCNVQPYVSDFHQSEVGLHPGQYRDWLLELHVKNKIYVPWRWKEDLGMILDFDFESVEPPPCMVVNHRIRGWYTERNCQVENTKAIINLILAVGLKPYISGRHAENVDDRAEYIPTLCKLASIIHHPNCKAFFSSGGPTLMAQQCCRNTLVYMDTCGMCQNHPDHNHPLFLSPFLNFSGDTPYVILPSDIEGAKKIILKITSR